MSGWKVEGSWTSVLKSTQGVFEGGGSVRCNSNTRQTSKPAWEMQVEDLVARV